MTENTLYKTAMNFYHGIEDTTELEYLGYKIQILKSISMFGEWGVVVQEVGSNKEIPTSDFRIPTPIYAGMKFASFDAARDAALTAIREETKVCSFA